MSITLRRRFVDVAMKFTMRLLPFAVILVGLLVTATFRYGTIRNAIAAVRGETLVIQPEVQSFGVVQAGRVISLSYSLTNLSSTPTRIFGSRTTCVCTMPEALPKILNSRETYVVRVIFHAPEHGSTIPEDGFLRQEVLLYTSDPSHPQVTLTLVGEVR